MNTIPRTTGILLFVIILSCCQKHVPKEVLPNAETRMADIIRVNMPKPGTIVTWGDSVKIALAYDQNRFALDSVKVLSSNTTPVKFTDFARNMYWQTAKSRVGQVTLKIVVYCNDTLQESHNTNLVILSDLTPVNYKYKVINRLPHDRDAYTQGLVYDKGMLYESTGLEKKSSLRIVDLLTGKPVKKIDLDPQFFGEGIALINDKVYQITYKTQVGFIYDKNSLELIRSFDYQIREGWGLTTDGHNLIMSDGSSQLYYLEPEFFSQTDRIEVFDQKGMVPSLNELEYVNGKVLANVYGETYIVFIDPVLGKVTGRLDLHDLMPAGFEGDYGKVLNGIAYNPDTKHLYVTGKDWPVLYEIAITPEP
jgi:glutamine cyclotransferase